MLGAVATTYVSLAYIGMALNTVLTMGLSLVSNMLWGYLLNDEVPQGHPDGTTCFLVIVGVTLTTLVSATAPEEDDIEGIWATVAAPKAALCFVGITFIACGSFAYIWGVDYQKVVGAFRWLSEYATGTTSHGYRSIPGDEASSRLTSEETSEFTLASSRNKSVDNFLPGPWTYDFKVFPSATADPLPLSVQGAYAIFVACIQSISVCFAMATSLLM
ncbi:hypothetical protein CYMTET_12624, partial [Cymbomonas tetramitiformis]